MIQDKLIHDTHGQILFTKITEPLDLLILPVIKVFENCFKE